MQTQGLTIQDAELGLWIPQPGDSLNQTLSKVYGLSPLEPLFKDIQALHMAINPEVFAAHVPLRVKAIHLADITLGSNASMGQGARDIIQRKLKAQQAKNQAAKLALEATIPQSEVEVEAMRFILGFNSVMGQVGTTIGLASGTISTLNGKHLHSDLLQFNKWAADKNALIQSGRGADLMGHYDARMDDVVKRINKRLGPLQRFFFNGTPTKQGLLNGVPQSLRPNPQMITVSTRAAQLASAAKVGTVALAGVDAVLICQKLIATPQEQKLQTAYSEIGGFFGALFAGAAVGAGIVAMATPVGWVAAIVITGVTSYGGKQIGEGLAHWSQTNFGDWAELKNGQVLNKWCN